MKFFVTALITTMVISVSASAEEFNAEVSAFDPIKINSPRLSNPNSFLDNEAKWNWSIAAMKGHYATAKGYDGRIYLRNADGSLIDSRADGRVVVGVIDTGVNSKHTELDANVLATKSVTCTTTSGCQKNSGADTGWHGTAVAGVIAAERNGTGMQGIAPNAQILPIAAIGVDNGSIADSINYAVQNKALVINNSYGLVSGGGEIPIIKSRTGKAGISMSAYTLNSYLNQIEYDLSLRQSIQNAVDAHSILVFANGNAGMEQVGVLAGLPYYFRGDVTDRKPAGYDFINPNKVDWSKNFVAVAALDSNLDIASYSNKCGISMNWCISAPGSSIISTYSGNGYVQASGTSFAAPNVSGSLALLMGAFPHLSPEQVTQILFKTATDLGARGVDYVYGHGLVNLQRAVTPSDSGWNIALTSSTTSNTAPVTVSKILLPSAFGTAIKNSALSVMFLDEYNRDYHLPVAALVSNLPNRITAEERLSAFGKSEFDYNAKTEKGIFMASFSEATPDKKPVLEKSFISINTETGKNTGYTTSFAHHVNLGEVMNPSAFSDMPVTSNKETTAFKNPYLGLAENVNAAVVGLSGKKDSIKMGFFSGDMNKNPDDFASSQKVSGAFTEIGIGGVGKNSLAFGINNEENSILGASSTGALALGSSSTTAYASFATKQELTDKLSFIANYNIGQTRVDAATSSLVSGTSNIISDSFAVGLEYKDIIKAGDNLQVSVSQPLRVMSGSSNLNLPQDVSLDGEVLFADEKVSLSATGRQLDLNAFYDVKLSDDEALKVGGVVSFQPGNDESANAEATIMAKYSLSF